jgi:hypothetical protein
MTALERTMSDHAKARYASTPASQLATARVCQETEPGCTKKAAKAIVSATARRCIAPMPMIHDVPLAIGFCMFGAA